MKKQNFSKYDLSSPGGNALGKLGFAVRDGISTNKPINQGGLPWLKKLMMGLPILFLLTPQWASSQVEAGSKTQDIAKSQITDHSSVRYGYETVDGLEIFYREAGDRNKPVIVLLHGFPASSHMYRDVLAGLAEDYYLIAPDYPAFGNSSFPDPENFEYTFDNLARVMDLFLKQKGIDRFSMMIQDYGAPIGFRLAVKHPERIQAIITQNGNAYKEGLSVKGWGPIFDYWKQKTPELETTIAENVFTFDGMKWQFTHGTQQPEAILPDTWVLAYANLTKPGQTRAQLDLFYDYQNNVLKYPEWQNYLRKHQPPVLVVWGKNDAFFPVEGAEGYKKDVEDLDYNVLDTGHFALEEEGPFIIDKIKAFLSSRNIQ
ncbi:MULTISPECIES: alpha/beta fold hydrolase [unclassified Methylophaga]|jgi:pimeloyl-ACP methyl ester carboxylesterase|uniref:alpha/beta fold hydrolase n=1 Tax=unclassified Methylophaga TaxID=2629249 RepID=UPI0025F6EA31|nr:MULTISPECIES: alpha/beta hydrolase [unclassified Methylophaga]|tara:strand:+ start:12209 stop:13327 length:1119 start_codon:yes stop_codon:yes gene_type:complete